MSKHIVKAGLCLMRDGRVLLARSDGDAHFQIPGGKIEAGESDIAALAREVREELAATLDVASAEHIATFQAAAAGRADTMVEVRLYKAGISGTPRPSSEIIELSWEDPAAPRVPCSDVVALHILPYLARRG